MLLDTHVVLWWLQSNRKLSRRSRARILAASAVYVSSVSIWEVAIKVHTGKLNVDLQEIVAEIAREGFLELNISFQHAAQVAVLPAIHRDPFDRMLIAQATCETMKLLTADRLLANYSDLVEIV